MAELARRGRKILNLCGRFDRRSREEPEATRTGREKGELAWAWAATSRCRARRGLFICVGAGWRGGALAVARRPSGRRSPHPEVVGSSQFRDRTTSGAGFSKARREVVPLGACGVLVCLRLSRRWYCFPLRFLFRLVPRLHVLRRRLVLLLLLSLVRCLEFVYLLLCFLGICV